MSHPSFSTDQGSRNLNDSAWLASIMAGPAGLRSRILRDDPILNDLLQNDAIDTSTFFAIPKYNSGEHIRLLELALKITVPQLQEGTKEQEAIETTISSTFSSQTSRLILLFQQGFNTFYSDEIDRLELPFKELQETGILDAATLYFIDRELHEIRYYDVDAQKVIHHNGRAVWVNEFVLTHKDAASLYTQPLLSELIPERSLVFNDRIFLLQVLQNKDWCFVELGDGERVYMKIEDLWTKSAMPEVNAKLFMIPSGDSGTLLQIVKDHYTITTQDLENELDRRFFANVLLYVNNPKGKSTKKRVGLNLETGVFDLEEVTAQNAAILPSDASKSWGDYVNMLFANPELPAVYAASSMWDTVKTAIENGADTWPIIEPLLATAAGTSWNDWLKAETRHGNLIWLPSKNFAYTLKEIANTGSITGNIRDAYKKFDENFFKVLKPILHEWWPPGHGVRIDFGLGATFAVPFGLDGDYYSYIYREADDTFGKSINEMPFKFKMYRRGWGRAGLDTGVGAGAFVSMGGVSKDNKWLSNSAHYGVGAGAGAELFVGGRALVQEEYEFDLDECSDLAFMLFMATQSDFFERLKSATSPSQMTAGVLPGSKVQTSSVSLILKMFEQLGVDIYEYLTRYKVEVAGVGSLAGAGSVGLRFASDEDMTPQEHRGRKFGIKYGDNVDLEGAATFWKPGEDNHAPYNRGNWGVPRVLTQALSLSLGLDITGEICLGLELEFPDGFAEDASNGYRLPNTAIASVYLDAELVGGINVSLLRPLLNFAPGVGGGIKGSMKFINTNGGFTGMMPAFTSDLLKISLYTKVGEMDFYDHRPSSEVILPLTLELQQDGSLPPLPQTFNQWKDVFEPATLEKRISLAQFMFDPGLQRYNLFRLKLTRMLKHNGDLQRGLIFEGWLTFKIIIDNDKFLTVMSTLATDLISNQGQEIEDLSAYVLAVLSGNTPPGTRPSLIDDILSLFVIDSVILHAEAGASIAGGFKAAEGAKVRIRGNVNAYHVYHENITETFKDVFQSIVEQNFITSLIKTRYPVLTSVIPINSLPTSTE